MPETFVRGDQPTAVHRAKFGWIANFTNAVDGRRYFQRTMPVRQLIAPPPRLVLENGAVERLNSRISHLYFKPLLISSETRTFAVTGRDSKRLVMSCFGAVYPLEMRKFARDLSPAALKQVAQDMAAVFRNVDIPQIMAGNVRDEFEHCDWHVMYYSERRLLSWGSFRKQPVVFVRAGVDKSDHLELFGVPKDLEEGDANE